MNKSKSEETVRGVSKKAVGATIGTRTRTCRDVSVMSSWCCTRLILLWHINRRSGHGCNVHAVRKHARLDFHLWLQRQDSNLQSSGYEPDRDTFSLLCHINCGQGFAPCMKSRHCRRFVDASLSGFSLGCSRTSVSNQTSRTVDFRVRYFSQRNTSH